MEAGGWLFKVSRGLCHLKIPDAAINAVGHLLFRSEETDIRYEQNFAFMGTAIICGVL